MVFGWFKKKKEEEAKPASAAAAKPAAPAAPPPASPPPPPQPTAPRAAAPQPAAPQPAVQARPAAPAPTPTAASPPPTPAPAPTPAAAPGATPAQRHAPWPAEQDAAATAAINALRNFLVSALRTERGLQAETLMVSAGALIGFSTINAVFEAYLKRGRAKIGDRQTTDTSATIVEIKGSDGQTYYFGDLINSFLAATTGPTKRPFFVWGYLAGIGINAGVPVAELPDINEMFQRAASTVGTPEFGTPRMPPNLQPMLTTRQALERLWPAVRAGLSRTDAPGANGRAVDVEHWPIVCTIVAQHLIGQTKGVLDMKVALRLVMESAIFMSKIDPRSVPQEMPPRA